MDIQHQKVTRELATHLPHLYRAVDAAVRKYNDLPPAVLLELNAGAAASNIHCFFVAALYRYAESRDDAWVEDIQGLKLFVTSSGYAIRFKKVGEDSVPRGGHTQQVKRFRSQEDFPELPQTVHLDLAYQLDALGKLLAVKLLCPSGPTANMWEVEVEEDEVVPVVVNLFNPVAPTQEPLGGKILGKPQKKNDETESGDGDPRA